MKKKCRLTVNPRRLHPIVGHKGLIHGIAECTVCGWREENYLVVQKRAPAHARTTGHRVMADLGYVVEYGSSNDPDQR